VAVVAFGAVALGVARSGVALKPAAELQAADDPRGNHRQTPRVRDLRHALKGAFVAVGVPNAPFEA
jgi:hypothetical protein